MTAITNYLAIDLGASGGRILLGGWDGSRIHLEEIHRFPNGPVNLLGHLHWDVLRIWSEVKAGLAKVASRTREPLAGIGVDTWGVDFSLLDRAGNLLGNPYHYRDSRTDGMLARAFRKVPRERLYEQTGIQFMQISTLYQLLAMVESDDPHLELADILLMMPDLFHYWLTGFKASEYTIASTSQMIDPWGRCWASKLLDELEIPSAFLPEILPPGSVLGALLPEVASEAGIPSGIPVIAPAGHDTANAVAAIPELDEHSVYLSSGTWSLMGVELRQPIVNELALAFNFTNEGGIGDTIRFLKNIPGLWLLQESRRQWQQEGRDYAWDELLSLAEGAEPFRSLVDPDAPDFLSPGDMPARIRAYCRRTGQPEPDDVGRIVRACLESLALRSRQVLEDLETLTGNRLDVVRIVGGGSQNHLLCQYTADACGRPVVAGPVEATALGNLLMQAIATGRLGSLAEGRQAVAASVERQFYEPEPDSAWEEAFATFKVLVSD